jgi:hypothetical protein
LINHNDDLRRIWYWKFDGPNDTGDVFIMYQLNGPGLEISDWDNGAICEDYRNTFNRYPGVRKDMDGSVVGLIEITRWDMQKDVLVKHRLPNTMPSWFAASYRK